MNTSSKRKALGTLLVVLILLVITIVILINSFSFVSLIKKYNSYVFQNRDGKYIAYLKNDSIFSNGNSTGEKALSESELIKLKSFDSGRYYMKKSRYAIGLFNLFEYIYPNDKSDSEILLDKTDIVYAYDKILGNRYYFIKENTHIPDLRKDEIEKIQIEDVSDSFEVTDKQQIEDAINSFSNLEKWEFNNHTSESLSVDNVNGYKVYVYYKDFPIRQSIGCFSGNTLVYDDDFTECIRITDS